MLITAISKRTGVPEAELHADASGIYTVMDGKAFDWFDGPFADVADAVASSILARRYGSLRPTILDARSKGLISDMEIAREFPTTDGRWFFRREPGHERMGSLG